MTTTRHNPRLAFQFLKQRYQSAVDDHLNLALAALREDWQPVRAVIAERIGQLEDAMSAAQDAGEPVNLTWLAQEGRLQQLLTTIDQAASGYGQTAADTIGDAQSAAVDLGSQAAQDLLQATVPPGMSYTFGVPPQGALDAMASALDEGSPLSGLLLDSFGADAAATAQQALFAGVALGQSAAQIASMLTEATDMSAQRAEVIARTEVQRAYRDAQMANYRANSDVVNGWMWSADFSDRTCGACIAMDGTIHTLDEDLDDHINGRCSALPVTNSYASILGQLGMTADDLPIAGLTDTSARYWTGQKGADWFASQSDAFQARILGPAKFAALQHGDITLSDLVGIRRSEQWGDSIYEKSLRELGFNARDYLTTYPLSADIARAEAAPLSEWERERMAAVEQALRESNANAVSGGLSEWEQARAAAIAGEATGQTTTREATVTEAEAAAAAETTVTFTSDAARTRLTNAFGQSLTDDQVAALAGAPPGSVVEADKYGQITVTAPDGRYTSSVYVHAAEADGGGPTLLNWRFEAPDGTNNIPVDAESLGRQVRQANELGVEGIHMKARSASADFEQLPRLGYDAPIAQVLVESESKTLPAGLEGVQSLQELLTYPAGRDWWHVNGMNPGLDFDPHPGSLSWRILDEHLQGLGLPGLDAPAVSEASENIAFTAAVADARTPFGDMPITAQYDLTPTDQAFTADLKQQIATLDQSALAHTDALDIGGQIHSRIESDLADFKTYTQEAADIRAAAPNLTDEQRAWVSGNADAVAAHGGVRFVFADAQYQAEYQARAAAYLADVRDLGGDIRATGANGARLDQRIADAVAQAQGNIPSDWIAASNDMGDLSIIKNRERNSGGWYMEAADRSGGGTIAVSYKQGSSDVQMQSTVLHEFMHRMEATIPQITQLERDYYESRTASEAFVDLTNGIKARTKLDQWVDEYLGREPLYTRVPAYLAPDGTARDYVYSYELLSIGAEAALGGGVTYDLNALRQDDEFMSFILGLLSLVRADGGVTP